MIFFFDFPDIQVYVKIGKKRKFLRAAWAMVGGQGRKVRSQGYSIMQLNVYCTRLPGQLQHSIVQYHIYNIYE